VVTPLITGVGMTAFGRFYERNLKSLARESVGLAMADSESSLEDVQAVFFSNALAGVMFGQECIRGETICYDLGLGNVSVVNVENACASAGTALHLAAQSVASEQYGTVLALGVEKMYSRDRSRPFRALWGALDVEEVPLPDSAVTLDRSPFIDVYAERARVLMRERGVTADGLARVASKAWRNGVLNDKAQRRTPRSVEEILASRELVPPLTCSRLTRRKTDDDRSGWSAPRFVVCQQRTSAAQRRVRPPEQPMNRPEPGRRMSRSPRSTTRPLQAKCCRG
jgi:acetyl-CoA acetyltransferase